MRSEGVVRDKRTLAGRRPTLSDKRRAELANPKSYPSTVALVAAFSRCLAPALPEGLAHTGAHAEASSRESIRRAQ